jgi:NDP-sugar pyrophosphorylase family protein
MQALLFAAGLGTRLKPLTDHLPKALVPVRVNNTYPERPMIEILLDKMYYSGFNHVVINVHHMADMIERFAAEYLELHSDWHMKINFSDERDLLLNTGGGIKKAGDLLDRSRPFLVHNVDIISNLDLLSFFLAHNPAECLSTLLVSERKTERYFLFDKGGRLAGWTNLKTGEVRSPFASLRVEDCQLKAFAGIHVISPEIFDKMQSWPDVFSIVDFYLSQAAGSVIRGYEIPGLRMVDIGKPESLQNITI